MFIYFIYISRYCEYWEYLDVVEARDSFHYFVFEVRDTIVGEDLRL